MDKTQQFVGLLADMERFVGDECVAVREENWEYLKELLAKKEAHLLAMTELAKDINLQEPKLKARLDALKKLEAQASALLSEKLDAVKGALNQVKGGRARIKKVQAQQNEMPGDEMPRSKGSLSAEA